MLLNPRDYDSFDLESGLGGSLFTKPHSCSLFTKPPGLRICDPTHYSIKNLRISYEDIISLKEQLKEAKSLHKSYSESSEIKVEPVSSLKSFYLGHRNIQIESEIMKRQKIRSIRAWC